MKIRSRNKRPYSSAFTGTSTLNYDKENKEHKLTFPSPDTTRALFELFYLRQLANQRSTIQQPTIPLRRLLRHWSNVPNQSSGSWILFLCNIKETHALICKRQMEIK